MVKSEYAARLREKAATLPLSPGVYIMKDAQGKVIYVGKSRKLKNRVSQYFQNGAKNLKTARMVAAARDFEYFLCGKTSFCYGYVLVLREAVIDTFGSSQGDYITDLIEVEV